MSPSPERMSPSQKKKSPKLKALGPLCNQTVNLKTDSKILSYSILKYKYSPSILSTTKAKRNMHRETAAMITATEITRTGYFYKYTSSDRSIDLCVLRNACYELFCVSGDFFLRQGRRPTYR